MKGRMFVSYYLPSIAIKQESINRYKLVIKNVCTCTYIGVYINNM